AALAGAGRQRHRGAARTRRRRARGGGATPGRRPIRAVGGMRPRPRLGRTPRTRRRVPRLARRRLRHWRAGRAAARSGGRPAPLGASRVLKLNLGCGPIQPAGWANLDGSRRAWFASRLPFADRWLVRCGLWPPTEFSAATGFVDLRRPLPWADG